MVTYWFPDLPDIKSLAGRLWWSSFDIWLWYLICMIQQAYEYVRSSLWPCWKFFSLKSPKIWNQIGKTEKTLSCHGNQFFIAVGLLPVELFAYQVLMVSANWLRLSTVFIFYIITQVILVFWLVLAYDLLEDRHTDDDSARFKFFWIFWILNLNQSQFFAKHSNQSVRFIFYRHKITSVLFSCLSKWRNLK